MLAGLRARHPRCVHILHLPEIFDLCRSALALVMMRRNNLSQLVKPKGLFEEQTVVRMAAPAHFGICGW